jgi:hypothetical protein
LIGRERFAAALRGDGVAFAPYVWERLAEFVHQPSADWWRDATTARRLLVDAASLAGADAMVVDACGEALRAVAAGGPGIDVLDGFADTDDARSAFALVEVLVESAPFAVVTRVPDLETLARSLGGGEPGCEEVAEDALSDVARGFLEAGADALLVMGSDAATVVAAAARLAGVARYYGRPLLAVVAGSEAWVEGCDGVEVQVLGDDGAWPPLSAGVVLTEDVSTGWDAGRLAEVGRAR